MYIHICIHVPVSLLSREVMGHFLKYRFHWHVPFHILMVYVNIQSTCVCVYRFMWIFNDICVYTMIFHYIIPINHITIYKTMYT